VPQIAIPALMLVLVLIVVSSLVLGAPDRHARFDVRLGFHLVRSPLIFFTYCCFAERPSRVQLGCQPYYNSKSRRTK
jgi:hypothetical protein